MLEKNIYKEAYAKLLNEEYNSSIGVSSNEGQMGSADYIEDFHKDPKLAAYNTPTNNLGTKKSKKSKKKDINNENPHMDIPNGPTIDMLEIAVKDLTTSIVEKIKNNSDEDINIDTKPYQVIARKLSSSEKNKVQRILESISLVFT